MKFKHGIFDVAMVSVISLATIADRWRLVPDGHVPQAKPAITMPVEPKGRKWAGQTIPAIRFAVTDRRAYRPVRTALLLIDEIRRHAVRNYSLEVIGEKYERYFERLSHLFNGSELDGGFYEGRTSGRDAA